MDCERCPPCPLLMLHVGGWQGMLFVPFVRSSSGRPLLWFCSCVYMYMYVLSYALCVLVCSLFSSLSISSAHCSMHCCTRTCVALLVCLLPRSLFWVHPWLCMGLWCIVAPLGFRWALLTQHAVHWSACDAHSNWVEWHFACLAHGPGPVAVIELWHASAGTQSWVCILVCMGRGPIVGVVWYTQVGTHSWDGTLICMGWDPQLQSNSGICRLGPLAAVHTRNTQAGTRGCVHLQTGRDHAHNSD